MKIKEIKLKNCLTKSKLTDYVINPYLGCEHGCKYCYATFMKRFHNIKEEWGDFVHIKINCLELLEKELERAKKGHIWISSVCDCYQPIEKKYKLTRGILEILSKPKFKDKFTIEILTKSSLVERDFDILKKFGENLELGMSIGMEDKYSKVLEPLASLPSERIETLKKAKERGIKIYGFISPTLPGIADLDRIFKKLKEADVEYVWVELLNIKKSVLDRLLPVTKGNFPEKIKDFEYMLNNYEDYCEKKRREIKELSKKYDLKVKEVVVHGR